MVENTMYIYGKQPVWEALRSSHRIKNIFIAREMQKKDFHRFKDLGEKNGVPVSISSKSQLQKYCGPVVHQGIVAEIDGYTYTGQQPLLKILRKAENPLVLVLDQIQDTHNLGAIIRTAEICAVTAIIIPEKVSAEINPTVVKTSAGAVFHSKIHRTTDLKSILYTLKDLNLTIAALLPGQNLTIYETDLKQPLALIIGSEGSGVRKNLLPFCDLNLSVPQVGKLDSLNASVSTAVVLFEILRQRRYG
jgi:23S rRNA (guanosine2251-2'-O)-methyltransferase